jgi:rod shape-determining protein MreD
MTNKPLEKPFFAFLTVLCFVLETKLEALGIRPNLTVLPVYYVGLRHGPGKGVLFGAFIGIIADSLSGGILGPNLLSKGAAALLASTITGSYLNWTPVLGAIGLFVITWADGIISLAALSVFAETPAIISVAAMAMLGQATVNCVAGVFIRPKHEE